MVCPLGALGLAFSFDCNGVIGVIVVTTGGASGVSIFLSLIVGMSSVASKCPISIVSPDSPERVALCIICRVGPALGISLP